MEEPEQTVPPPVPRHSPPPPAHRRPPDEGDEDEAADERTSPFPYAENFDEWVADETAAPDGRQHHRDQGSHDVAP